MHRSNFLSNIQGCIRRYDDSPGVEAWMIRAADKLPAEEYLRLSVDVLDELHSRRSTLAWQTLAFSLLDRLNDIDPSHDLDRRRHFDDELNASILLQEKMAEEEKLRLSEQKEKDERIKLEQEKLQEKRRRASNARTFLDARSVKTDGLSDDEILAKAIAIRENERIAKLHLNFLSRIGISSQETPVIFSNKKERAHRTPNCYECKRDLDNTLHLECRLCDWIVCPTCGACGCGYNRM